MSKPVDIIPVDIIPVDTYPVDKTRKTVDNYSFLGYKPISNYGEKFINFQ